jgi:glutamate transport system substrate-binding protein
MHAIVRRAVVAAAAAGLSLTALVACGSDGGPVSDPSPVPGASSGGTLKIGISFDEPGLGLKTADGYEGFDVDTATYVAKALGVAEDGITWVEAQPANREKLLADGSVDLVVATYSITEERRQQVDFAGPYFVAHQDLLVRRNDEEITGPETLDGRNLCSVTGTTSAQLVKERYKGKITLQELPQYSECVTKLADGEVDAVTTDDLILAGYAAQQQYRGKLRLVGEGFSDEIYGIGVKKGNTDLVTKVNAALKQYIADGSWERSLKAEVGPSGYAIPNPPSPGA